MLRWIKTHFNLLFFVFLGVISIVLYIFLIRQSFFSNFILWSQQNIYLYFSLLVLFKIIGIVWPPLPGGVLTLGSIPVIGWQLAYLADVLGGFIGACLAYLLGRLYGSKIIDALFDESVTKKINLIKVKKEKEIEAIAVLRIFYGTLSEFISYGSGLLGVSLRNFIIGVLLSQLIALPMFYLVSQVLSGKGIFINGLIFIVAIMLFFKFKKRYFH